MTTDKVTDKVTVYTDEIEGFLRDIRSIQADLSEVRRRLGPDGTGDDNTRWLRAELATIGDNNLSLLAKKIAAAATGTVPVPPI